MEGIEIEVENKDEALKTQVAVRCAKAAIFLSSLKSSKNCRLHSTNNGEQQDCEMRLIRRAAEDLRVKLVRERVKNRRIRLCSTMELLLLMALCIASWTTLCFLLACNFL